MFNISDLFLKSAGVWRATPIRLKRSKGHISSKPLTQTADVSGVGRVHHLCACACLRLKHLTQLLAASVGFPDCIREIDQTVRRALCVLFCALGQCAVLIPWPVRWTSTSWKPYDAAAAYGNHTVYPKMLYFCRCFFPLNDRNVSVQLTLGCQSSKLR